MERWDLWEIRDFSVVIFPNRGLQLFHAPVPHSQTPQPLPLTTFIHLYLTFQLYVLNVGEKSFSRGLNQQIWTNIMSLLNVIYSLDLNSWPFSIYSSTRCAAPLLLGYCRSFLWWLTPSLSDPFWWCHRCYGRVIGITSMSNPCESETVMLSLCHMFPCLSIRSKHASTFSQSGKKSHLEHCRPPSAVRARPPMHAL